MSIMTNFTSVVPNIYRNDDYLNRLRCENCKCNYSGLKAYRDTICHNCAVNKYQEIKNLSNIRCSNCLHKFNNDCKFNCGFEVTQDSQKVVNFRNFITLNCQSHSQQTAEKISKPSLSLYCTQCITLEDLIPVKYSLIEETFKNLALEHFKTLCYERKRKMITFTLADMLKACRWMNQINEGLVCVNHPDKISKFIDPRLNTLCRTCNKNQEIRLDNIGKVAEMVIEIAREKARNCNPSSLNKFMIRAVNLFRRPEVNTVDKLRILILETRDLLNEVDFQSVRCVKCLKKILVGNKSGVLNSCSHVFCFDCYSSEISFCPIDNEEVTPKTYFRNTSLSIPTCHGFHEFTQGTIYKLPCFHLSCEQHKDYGHCVTCGLNFSVLEKYKTTRVSQTSKDLLEFFDVRCPSHPKKQIDSFSFQSIPLKCSECPSGVENIIELPIPGLPKFKSWLFENVFKKIETLKNFEINAYSISAGILKVYTYLRVLSYQMVMNFYNILRVRHGLLCLESAQKVVMFDIIRKKCIHIEEAYQIRDDARLIFTLVMIEDMVCSGVILNKIIMSNTGKISGNMTTRPVIIKCFKDKSRNVLEKEFELLFAKSSNHDDYSECCLFNSSIYMKESQIFDFYVPISSGQHFFSKAFSKVKTDKFKIEKSPKSAFKQNDISGYFGAVLRGLIISGVMDFFEVNNT